MQSLQKMFELDLVFQIMNKTDHYLIEETKK